IEQRPAGLDIRDVEEVLVRASREADAEFLADGRMRAVAAAEKHRLALSTIQARRDAIACLREVDQLGVALDTNAQLFEVRDQQSLVFVLRVEQPVRKGCGDRAQLAELDARRP